MVAFNGLGLALQPDSQHYEGRHISSVTVSSPLLHPLEGGPQAGADIVGPTGLVELLGRDRRRCLALAAFTKAQGQGRTGEGLLFGCFELEGLHVLGSGLDHGELVDDAEGAFDDLVLDVALVRL